MGSAVDHGAASMASEAGSTLGPTSIRGGLPRYAAPWMEMGKLRERERWQGFTAQLLQGAIAFELEDLKRGMVEALTSPPPSSGPAGGAAAPQSGFRATLGRPLSSLPRSATPAISPDVKNNLTTFIDSSKARISSIFAEYIKFFTSDTKPAHVEDATVLDKLPSTSGSNDHTPSVDTGMVWRPSTS